MTQLWVFLITLFLTGSNSLVTLLCCSEYCLSESVLYQCVVTESIILTWRIKDETMTLTLGTETYSTNDAPAGSFSPIPDVPQFSTDLSSTTPSIVSNISFTVQTSINGYTIICEDAGGDMKNCTVRIADIPSSPNGISIMFKDNFLLISWVQSTSHCVTKYIIDSNITRTITTTDTSVTIPLAGLSVGTYYYSIAAIDTANRTGMYTEGTIELQKPSTPTVSESIHSMTASYYTLGLSWSFPLTDRLPVISVYLSYVAIGLPVITEVAVNNNHTTVKLQCGLDYTINVFGENALGNGSISSLNVSWSIDIEPSTTTITASQSTSAKTKIGTIAVSISVTVITTFVLVIITVIVAIIAAFCCMRKKRLNDVMRSISNRTKLRRAVETKTMKESEYAVQELTDGNKDKPDKKRLKLPKFFRKKKF